MANKSTKRATAIAARRRRVGAMYLQGWTQPEIAVELKVSQPCISLDLKWLRADWLERARASYDQVKATELAKIDWLEKEYAEAWQKSKAELVSTLTGSRGRGQRTTTEARISKQQREGDGRYLAGIQWCISKRLEIFGISAAAEAKAGDWRGIVASWGLDPDDFLGLLRDRRAKAISQPAPGLPVVIVDNERAPVDLSQIVP